MPLVVLPSNGESPGLMRLKRVFVLLAIPVVALGAWTVVWFRIADEVKASVDAFAADQAKSGRSFAHADVAVNGWPFRVEATVPQPVLTAENGRNTVRADRVVVYVQPLQMRHLVAVIEGPIIFADATARIELEPEHAASSLVFDEAGRLERGALDMTKIKGRMIEGDAPPAAFTMERLQVHERREAEGGARAALEMEGLDPEAEDYPTLSRLFIDVTRPQPIDEPVDRAALERWRDAGGTVDLTRFEAIAGEVTVTGDGTFAVDKLLRPEGAASFRIAGAEELLARLENSGRMTPQVRAMLEQMLGLFEQVEEGGRKAVRVPVTIQAGVLTVAGLPIVPVAPLLPPEQPS